MQNTFSDVWTRSKANLKGLLNPELYQLWFQRLEPVELDEQRMILGVPNDFSAVWLKENYLSLLEDVVAHESSRRYDIGFRVVNPEEIAPSAEVIPHPASAKVERLAEPEEKVEAIKATAPAEFNPKNTFETFVVGNNNRFAQAACMAVAQSPGKAYNPLFLYGGVGLGKTHLLHAIGQFVAEHKKRARVAYLSSEKFTNEYIEAIQNNKLAAFRKKYRQTDVLLIDDIQFLAGKDRLQEEFFHTFNALHEGRKQIVLTCDRPANEIKNLEQRLVSRFEWGLATDLQPPEIEMRLAILQNKAHTLNLSLPQEIMEFLAQRIRSNVRRLEGALIRVASYASLTGNNLTLEAVEDLLREVLQEEGRHVITVDLIQKTVAEHYDLRVSDMVSKRRPENIAFPRQIAMFLTRNLTNLSLSAIGDHFGGRDHGTVLHACRLVKDRMDQNGEVRQAVSYLEKQLQR